MIDLSLTLEALQRIASELYFQGLCGVVLTSDYLNKCHQFEHTFNKDDDFELSCSKNGTFPPSAVGHILAKI